MFRRREGADDPVEVNKRKRSFDKFRSMIRRVGFFFFHAWTTALPSCREIEQSPRGLTLM